MRRPNVIVVICDDLGYGDLGCYGGTLIRTPALDRLAAHGARFTAMYSGGPTCTPTRAALLTGRVAPRTGAGRVFFPGEGIGLSADEMTIASYLGAQGYATGCFGKWHIGEMPAQGPRQFGFDTYFGLPFSNDMQPVALYRDETIIEEPADVRSLSRRYVAEATAFMEAVPASKPFFAYIAFTMPHHPVTPEPGFSGRSAAGAYGDVIEAIDHYVGELRDALQQRGQLEDTIMVFTSDHGPWFEGSAGSFRGRKFETWEGGMRIPFIISWPGTIPAGKVITAPAGILDLLPTICGAVRIDTRSGKPLDGENIMPWLTDEKPQPHGPIWFFDGYALNAVRDGQWKLHRRRQSWGGDRFGQWSLPQLFDLDADPAESYDLAARHPDLVRRLLSLMEEFEADLPREEPVVEWWK